MVSYIADEYRILIKFSRQCGTCFGPSCEVLDVCLRFSLLNLRTSTFPIATIGLINLSPWDVVGESPYIKVSSKFLITLMS